jgi:hypothetical protein
MTVINFGKKPYRGKQINKKTPFYVTIVLLSKTTKSFKFTRPHFVDRKSCVHVTSSVDYLPVVVILNPTLDRAAAAPTAADTGVEERVGAALGAALRLCAMCALTRCPAARAAHKLSSPAKTPAATMRAS